MKLKHRRNEVYKEIGVKDIEGCISINNQFLNDIPFTTLSIHLDNLVADDLPHIVSRIEDSFKILVEERETTIDYCKKNGLINPIFY